LPRKTEQSGEKQKSALSQSMRTEADFFNSFMKEKSALKADFGQISDLHIVFLDQFIVWQWMCSIK
jgi:hypothetical protein